jgi:hypothetical protein
MRERMTLFEDTIKELEAESFAQGMDGNLGQEMQGIADIESLVEAASAEVAEKEVAILVL